MKTKELLENIAYENGLELEDGHLFRVNMIDPRDLAPCDGIDCNRRYSCQRFKNAKEFKQLIHDEIVLTMPLIASPIHDGNCQHFYPIEGQIQEQESRYCGSANPKWNRYEP